MRLVEVRLLEGPNLYRLEPTVKIEVTVGRLRSWYGQRTPGAYAIVRLGRPVARRKAPPPVRDLAGWVTRLHRLSGTRAGRPTGTSVPVTVHRTGEPGHWIVAFPWRERERAQEIADGAWRLAEAEIGAHTTPRSSRALERTLRRVTAAAGPGPAWITDGERRIPTISISGTNGKSTTTRMLTHILRRAGRHVGTTTSDGVLIDERLIEPGDWTGPGGAGQVLGRSDVDVAVLETARGGILLKGVGYESNDVAVLTNVELRPPGPPGHPHPARAGGGQGGHHPHHPSRGHGRSQRRRSTGGGPGPPRARPGLPLLARGRLTPGGPPRAPRRLRAGPRGRVARPRRRLDPRDRVSRPGLG